MFVSDENCKVAEIFHHGKLPKHTGTGTVDQQPQARYSSQMHSSHHMMGGWWWMRRDVRTYHLESCVACVLKVSRGERLREEPRCLTMRRARMNYYLQPALLSLRAYILPISPIPIRPTVKPAMSEGCDVEAMLMRIVVLLSSRTGRVRQLSHRHTRSSVPMKHSLDDRARSNG